MFVNLDLFRTPFQWTKTLKGGGKPNTPITDHGEKMVKERKYNVYVAVKRGVRVR
jgi:hypothetical protein